MKTIIIGLAFSILLLASTYTVVATVPSHVASDQLVAWKIRGQRHYQGPNIDIKTPPNAERRRKGDKGLKPIDIPKFDIPTPGQVGVKVVVGGVHFVLWLLSTGFVLCLWAVAIFLVYKFVRRRKGKETRLLDTIDKLKARLAAHKAILEDRLAEIKSRQDKKDSE